MLTKRRYTLTTMFEDHYSDLTCAYLHQSNDRKSVLEEKKSFEDHGDNSTFVDVSFIAHVESRNQFILNCTSDAQHQNGRAEKDARDMTERARVSLLCSM